MQKKLGDLLVEAGFITEVQLHEALAEQQQTRMRLGDQLIHRGLIAEKQLIEVLEQQLGIPQVELYKENIESDAVELVSQRFAEQHLLLPLRIEGNKLIVAMADPLDYGAIEELRAATGMRVEPMIASQSELLGSIKRYVGLQETVHQMLRSVPNVDTPGDPIEEEQNAPVVKLVNQMLAQAIQLGASDIHIDPQEDSVRIRYRIDGMMRTERTLPANMKYVTAARLKVMAGLDVAERRLPQDGRIELDGEHRNIDIRISTLPTVYGEKVVLRILSRGSSLIGIDQLGFTETNLDKLRRALSATSGMVLLTGPTGSGKTTTLYAALSQLNRDHVNVVTIEDPVEIQLPGINQVQVNTAAGLTFARGLRAILRQDPNVVMVGEVRDLETAEIAVRAAMTGHLVLSTMHTNNAVNAMTRLIDMGVESFLVASSLSCVIAQRLVRLICDRCADSYIPRDEERRLLLEHGFEPRELRRGSGCRSCDNSGYRGRMAIQEVLLIDEGLSSMILQQRSDYEYLNYALRQGMVPMMTDGLSKVELGLTTISEVYRVTQ